MFTDCPYCERQFRIRAAQLGAADGWVRCGNCGETFYALERLSDTPLKQLPTLGQTDEAAAEPPAVSVEPEPEEAVELAPAEPEQEEAAEPVQSEPEQYQPVVAEAAPEGAAPAEATPQEATPEDIKPEQSAETVPTTG